MTVTSVEGEDKLTIIWKRHFATYKEIIAALVGLCSLISAIYFGLPYVLQRNSHVGIEVTGADENHVYVKVSNTGHKPAKLVGYRLVFDDLPRKEIALGLSHADTKTQNSIIEPGASNKIGITTLLPDDIESEALREKQYTDMELASLLRKQYLAVPITLEIDVTESNDPGNLWVLTALQWIDPAAQCQYIVAPRLFHVRVDRVSAERIRAFINGSIRP
jgi:hypothetical protein